MGNEMEVGFLSACFVLGVLGAGLGAWAFSQAARAQLKAQRRAFELASEQAQRDFQQALLCVPQWVQRATRIELELLGRQHTARHKALLREQQHWQSEQETQRQAEWRTLLSGLSEAGSRERGSPADIAQAGKSTPAQLPAAADPDEATDTYRSPPALIHASEAPERALSDEEIDALPPDLPAPVRLQRRKISAPNKPILRNI
ncbi:hypothetical protein [Variovorax sp. 770b2]|uniref:hypothetical protein n=1 Tax=Variovorax sp. 770b2 TaxID=1566271 RepID=UPI0008EE9DBD|nr:hypothetical protein [Variovorax sp. 770b2]SFP42284.1 hypothetical protein SAMN03159339_2271 [Variovorax sp. 770b2]